MSQLGLRDRDNFSEEEEFHEVSPDSAEANQQEQICQEDLWPEAGVE